MLFDGCADETLAIRKTSISALSKLVAKHPTDVQLSKTWLGAVFPLIKDPVISLITRIILISLISLLTLINPNHPIGPILS